MKKLINLHPSRSGRIILAMLPFIILLVGYLIASNLRLEANPNDKLMPALETMVDTMERLALEPSKRSGEYLFWNDTLASLERLWSGVIVSALIGLIVGVVTGILPLIRAHISPFLTVISLIPPMAILPILFVIFGLGEFSKVALIVIGTAPFIARDIQNRVTEIPRELIIKAQTLGANSWQVITRLVLPQVLPRLLETLRLSLGTAWLFLIAAEAIASTEGLGYRIFLMRRYLAMDVILPYVAWITLLAFLNDYLIRVALHKFFPWYYPQPK